MTEERPQPATIWAATWVPEPSPLAGFGETGYSVAWVDRADGMREQVLVAGDSAPSPGQIGLIDRTSIDGIDVAVFAPTDGVG